MSNFDLDQLKISISGLRGLSPEVLNTDLAYSATRAYCQVLEPGPIVASHDPRPTSPELYRAVIQALLDEEREVLVAGIVPLPTTALAIKRHLASGAIMVTASHNPVEYNGLKCLDKRGRYLDLAQLEQFQEHLTITRQKISHPDNPEEDSILDIHESAMLYHQEIARQLVTPGRRLRIAVDAVNGAGSELIPQFLDAIDCDCIRLATDTTQPFPHIPEPTPDNLVWTQEQLQGLDYDFCAVVDPDADRLVLIDNKGQILSEELTLPLIAKSLIKQGTSGIFVVNLSTSSRLDLVLRGSAMRVQRSAVGEANVADMMEQTEAVFGGEGNGGVIDPSVHLGRDALTGIAHIVNLLRHYPDSSLHDLASDLPTVAMIKTKVPARVFDTKSMQTALESEYGPSQLDTKDGLHLTWSDDSWVHVRASNTEPIVRIIAETDNQPKTEQLIARVSELLGQD